MSKIKAVFLFLKTEKGMGILFVTLAIIINAIVLRSELTSSTLSINDEVLHYTATQDSISALRQGLDPTDFWLSQIGMGYPLFHHYQNLPQLVLTVLNLATSSFLTLASLFNISRYFLLILFPLSIFWSMRRFGFNYLAAGLSALFASLLSTNGLYGFDWGSYVWKGYGLYTQLWAMFFIPLALAEIYRAVKGEQSLFWPVFLTTIVLLSNLLYGYILFLSAIFFVFLRMNRTEIFSRFKHLVLVFILVGIVNVAFILPSFLDRNYFNQTIWFPSYRYDSYGYSWVLSNLFKGNLFDFGRFPSFTILFFLGIIALIVSKRYREEKNLILLLLTVVWLLLYFGRATWGAIFNVLPLSSDLQMNRFIGGFHLASIMLIGAGLSQIWYLLNKHLARYSFLILFVIIAFLSPIYIERAQYSQQDGQLLAQNNQVLSGEQKEISAITSTLKDLPPGKVFAGLPTSWGNSQYYRIGSIPFYAIFPQVGLDSFGYAYHAFALSDDVRLLFNDAKPVQYNLFDIRYVLLHKSWTPASFYTPVKEFDNYVLYQVPGTGYFDLVDATAVFYGSRSDFYQANSRWLLSSLPDTKQNPILVIEGKPKNTSGLPVFSFQEINDSILSSLDQSKTGVAAGKIIDEKAQTNKYSVQFEADRDSYLMLKSNYHPGWHVYLDNMEVAPVMLVPGFVGIKIQPGIHQALFVYRSPTWRLPLMALGAIILVALMGLSRKNYTEKVKLGIRKLLKVG
jgi:hypothetical protein